jgi:hypothetical protein
MPLATAGFERINSSIVNFTDKIQLSGNIIYTLRSVVIAETNNSPQLKSDDLNANSEMVIGSSTLCHNEESGEWLHYNPLNVIKSESGNSESKPVYRTPDNADKLIKEKGLVFIYEDVTYNTNNTNGFVMNSP